MAAPTLLASGAFAHGTTDASNVFAFTLDLSSVAPTADFLVLHIGFVDSVALSVASSSYNSAAATECTGSEVLNDATAVGRGHLGIGLWGLVNPHTAGSASGQVVMSSGQPTRMMVGWSAWSGVDPTTPFGTVETSTDEGTSATFTVDPATTENDVAIGSMVSSTNAATDVTPAGTQLYEVDEQSSFGTNNNGQYLAHDGSSPTTLTWTKGATRQAAGVGVALQGVADGGGLSIPIAMYHLMHRLGAS